MTDALDQHCEVVAVVIRGGPAYRQPGDPFAWACYVARCSRDAGYLLAMTAVPRPSEVRRARSELLALGFRRLEFTRTDGRRGRVMLAGGE
jgi:hypothetical protein